MTCAQRPEDAGDHQQRAARHVRVRLRQQACGKRRREQRDRAQIQQQRVSPGAALQGRGGGSLHQRRALELRQPLVDQIEPDMRRSIVSALSRRALVRQLDRLARDLAFGQSARPRDPFHGVPVGPLSVSPGACSGVVV